MKNGVQAGFVCLAELVILAWQHNVFGIVVIEKRPDGFVLNIPDDYNKNMPPKQNDIPVEVSVNFTPSKVVDISLERMTLQIALIVSVVWSDHRIIMTSNSSIPSFTYFHLRTHEDEQLWKPKLNFRNAMGNVILTENVNYFDGKFVFQVRKSPHFHCSFNLASYPMDIQQCKMEVQAINYKSSVRLVKYPRLYDFTSKTDPKEYRIGGIYNGNCTSSDHFGRYYSCVEYGFTLKRRLGRHLLQTFIPSGLIVILSWVSFWLHPVISIGPRVSLSIMTVLTLVKQFDSAQNDLPIVPYLKAIDIWMLACMFLASSTLLEFTFAYIDNKNSCQQKRTPLKNKIAEQFRKNLKWSFELQQSTCTTDKLSRRAFPLFFVCFNLIFWCYYGF